MSTATATVPDNGLSEILSFKIGPAPVGAYTLTITPISDSGISGTALTAPVTIGGAPLPPGVPIYVSGDITATVISFAASATTASTYNIYMPQEVGGPTFIETPATTHSAGTGTISVTCPGLADAAGDVTFFVTSLFNGIESKYQKVKVTYLVDGTVPSLAPNVPQVTFNNPAVDGGRNIEVQYIYDKTGQAVAPAKVQTKTKKYETGTETTQSAVNIAAFGANIARANLTIASGSDGWFQVAIRSVSAGSVNSAWSTYSNPVWCSTEVIAAVTNLVTNVTG